MGTIDSQLDAGDAILVVYSPDAIKAGLVGELDAFIHARSGARLMVRGWVQHTEPSIEEFYSSNLGAAAPRWHLVSQLFRSGSSLASVWQGVQAESKIPAIKGSSHPSVASPGTIRSRFWCDNPVTNLVHVSDTALEAHRELRVLRGLGWNAAESSRYPPQAANTMRSEPVHNAIYTTCKAIERALALRGVTHQLVVPSDDTASTCYRHFLSWMQQSVGLHDDVDELLLRFLDCDSSSTDLEYALRELSPLSQWEALLSSCAFFSRAHWHNAGQHDDP